MVMLTSGSACGPVRSLAEVNAGFVDRFQARIKQRGPNSCWPWTGYINEAGYGVLWVRYRRTIAHRVAWMLKFGEIPIGKVVRNVCNNSKCVNPKHLRLATHATVKHESQIKQRHAFGVRHFNAKLNDESVREILLALSIGASESLLAREYGVCTTTIVSIAQRRNWKHVPAPKGFVPYERKTRTAGLRPHEREDVVQLRLQRVPVAAIAEKYHKSTGSIYDLLRDRAKNDLMLQSLLYDPG